MLSWFHARHLRSLLPALVLGTYFIFGLHHLTQFVTADEHYWVYERIPQYWDAVATGNWKKTFINDKPGVSLALVSGIGYFMHPDAKQHCTERTDRTLHCDVQNTESLYRDFRLPILVVNALVLLFLFWIIQKLSGYWVALFTLILTALSPILLGMSQIVNPDSLLWSFGAAALFSFFALLSFNEKKFLFLTASFTALAILSKYVAVILFPFFLAIIILRFLTAQGKEGDKESLRALLQTDIMSYGVIVTLSLLLVCFFLPALLVDRDYLAEFVMTIPDKEILASIGGLSLILLLIDTWLLNNRLLFFFRRIISSLSSLSSRSSLLRTLPFSLLLGLFFVILMLGLVIARNFFPEWSLFTAIAFDLKDLSDARYTTAIPGFFESFLLEWNPLAFSLTPIALIGFSFLLVAFFQKKNQHYFISVSILFFFLVYTLLLMYANILTTPRYSILLYPLFAYLAALGFQYLIAGITFHRSKLLVFLVVLIGSLWSLSSSAPFYFNYTNVLLPKNQLIQDAWGYGGYEAAEYLNALPDAENLTVWADYYGVCEFFVGRCLTAYTFDATLVKPDYYVLTRRGKARYLSRHSRWERLSGLTAYKYYGLTIPDWQMFIDGRPGNFVKVVKVMK